MGKKYDELVLKYDELASENYELRQKLKDATFQYEPYVSPREGQLELILEQANKEKDRLVEFAKAMNLDAAVTKIIGAMQDIEKRNKPVIVEKPQAAQDWILEEMRESGKFGPFILEEPGDQPRFPDEPPYLFCEDCGEYSDSCECYIYQ